MVDAAPKPVPEPVEYVRDLLRGFDAPWFLCGGWAVDAWLGRQTRPHWDVDIAVFHHHQRAIFTHLPGWALVGHDPNVADDTTEPWNGRHLDLPAHVHVPALGGPLATSAARRHAAFELEFLLNARSDHGWVLDRQRRLTVPVEFAASRSAWGLPTVAPEILLFYKAGGDLTAAERESRGDALRPQDEEDLRALLPILTDGRRSWLRESLAAVDPAHPWLVPLATTR